MSIFSDKSIIKDFLYYYVRLAIVIGCCLLANCAYADNYFGAELSMKPINQNGKNFRITLTEYLDNHYVSVSITPLIEGAVIWRKRDNQMMFFLNVRSKPDSAHFLKFPNPKCAEANNLDVYRTTLFQDVFLDPNIYNDPQGYMIVFDRCCRPVDLTNITDSRHISLSIILEFPAISTKNSSPVFTIKSEGEYICKGKPFTSNFGATDADGDELRYSLVNPLSGYTSLTSQEGPYYDLIPRTNRRTVTWANGYSKDNAIPGSPPLTINPKTGEISVTPLEAGFYGFSILVEEYRNGVKIGSTQRDFSIKVAECPIKTLPKPTISYNTKPITSLDLCTGTTGTIMTDNNPDWHYQWQKDGVNLPKDTINSLTVSAKGVYTLITSSNKECTAEISSDLINVAIVPSVTPPKIKADKKEACEGEIINLSLQDLSMTVDWFQDGTLLVRNKTITVNKSGDYSAKLTSGTTCPASQTQDAVKLTFYPIPFLPPPSESEYQICPGDTIVLQTDNKTTFSYQWFKDNAAISKATKYTLKIGAVGNYTVKVKENVCETTSAIYFVKLASTCGGNLDTPLYIPNAFSPNGDGKNEGWVIKNLEKYPNSEVFIYDRWGEPVFHSTGYTTPWDGTIQGQKAPMGSYVYKIIVNNSAEFIGTLSVFY